MSNQDVVAMNDATAEIRQVLQRFQDGYALRDIEQVDEFMQRFVQRINDREF